METNRETEAPGPTDLEAAVHNLDRDVIIVANAGAGKTYLLVEHYFALLEAGLDPAHLVAFTFTEKAAKELKERVHKRIGTHPGFCDLPEELLQDWRRKLLAASIGTIHQFCLQVIDAARPAGQRKAFKVVDEALEETLKAERLRVFLRELFVAENPDALRLLKAFGIGKLRELIFSRIEMFYSETQAPSDLPDCEPAEAELLQSLESLARDFLESLDRRKAELGWMSFSDMERRALALLSDPNEALRKFLKPMQHLLVDEFQDTSPIQIRILQALRALKGPKGLRLFAVGDPKQSIYRFRDVDRHLILRTQEEILRNGGLRFDSAMNWRSVPELLELVNAYSTAAFPDALPSQARRESQPGASVLLVELESGEKKLKAEEQGELEAARVSSAIAELLKETPAEEIAVLYRTSGAVEPLIRALQARGIPYCIRGGQNLFERQEIFDLHRLVYFLGNPKDDLSLVGILRSPLFLLSDAALFFLSQQRGEASLWEHLLREETSANFSEKRPEEAEKFQAIRQELIRLLTLTPSQSPSRLLERLIRRGGFGELYALASGEAQRWLAIEQWLEWLKAMEADEAPLSWAEVSRRLRETSELQPNKTPLGDLVAARGSVQLLTLHKAKGLEFDTVFLVGMNKTAKPDYPLMQRFGGMAALKVPDPREEKGIRFSERYKAIQALHKSEEAEENKRLLYVALTRAKRRLFVVLQSGEGTKGTLQFLLRQSLGETWRKWRGEMPLSEDGNSDAPTPIIDPPTARSLKATYHEATVSELETFQVCPLKHHFAYRLQVPQDRAELDSATDATEVGTLLHEALNLLHISPGRSAEEAIQLALEGSSHGGDLALAERLRQNLGLYLNSDLYREISEAVEDYSELPFVLRLGEVDLRGQIDRLARDQDGWQLIDFKYSDRPTSPKELLSAYGFQLKTYALAATRLLRTPIRRAQIHVLNRAERHDFQFSEAEIQGYEKELQRLTEDWAAGGQALHSIRWRPACAQCTFHREVSVCPVPQGRPFRE
jgi:ATP-dependent helicase/nuclease subunit A